MTRKELIEVALLTSELGPRRDWNHDGTLRAASPSTA